jgi:phenylacetate-CoA ligase
MLVHTKTDLRRTTFGLSRAPEEWTVHVKRHNRKTNVGYTQRISILRSGGASLTWHIHCAIPFDSLRYGPFTGGLGLHYGAEKVGATVIPISSGNTRKQLQFMTDFNATILACTPSYAAHLGESILKEGISPEDVKLRAGVFGAEPWSNEMRREIENYYISKHTTFTA